MNAPDTVAQFLAGNELIEHDVQQGTPEWEGLRLNLDGSSESAAMLGLSKKVMRTELLRMKSTGIAKEYSAWVIQNLFEPGHEKEASARPIIEKQIGRSLYPVTYSRGRISASCDGLTADGNLAWEHKQWNTELAEAVRNQALPDTHMPQCQQILLVTGAEKLIFTVSDGTEENMVSTVIIPDRAWFERIILGWAQFNKERETYRHVEIAEKPKGATIMDLPALSVQATGMVTYSNLPEFKAAAESYIANINTDLVTDQHFADAEATVKFCKATEEKLEVTKSAILAQTATIDEVIRTVDHIQAQLRDKRLMLDKLVKSEKEARKAAMVAEAVNKWASHIAELEAEIKPMRITGVQQNFAAAIKGLKSLASMHDALNTALANCKIQADIEAKEIRAKLAIYKNDARGYEFLFADLQAIIVKPQDDFILAINSRITNHKAAEAERKEAERQRIEAEATAKAEREAAAKLAAEEARIRAEERAKAEEDQRAKSAEATHADRERAGMPLAPAPSSPPNNVCQFKPSRPSDKELIEFVAQNFDVSYGVACDWILETAERMKQAA